MIEIDGSFGEGGGQLLRYSVALAALLGEEVRVYNIRAKRGNPGLRPQHLSAVKFIAQLVKAQVDGLRVGSTEIVFRPTRKRLEGGTYTVDIGTAGSVILFLQATLPVLAAAREKLRLEVRGGTSVRWSPPYHYFERVLLPLFGKAGVKTSSRLVRHGFYPEGGGVVQVAVEPSYPLQPLRLEKSEDISSVQGVSYVGNLPCEIAVRQASSAKAVLERSGYPVGQIVHDCDTPSVGRGTGIVLWARVGEGVVGGDSLGEKGKPAEKVGAEAAEGLLKSLRLRVPVDPHAADNLVIYMSLASGESYFETSESTLHLETALELCRQILGSEYRVDKYPDGIKVRVRGVGFVP
ncbi:RNA 3'-terminal phosphate cyclase [Infirmifilum lucidum]|uniref:RNA 3'-terminal phosphate cyclase n=1 Tax=Infirmifilum lucidum TaxID=2776706 RepID=A0A7L9FHL6_9CREN|nr:RNA 3'-terminal phosphate cyclase [Infirmifilum lucidum]QOJ78404.1 RNA 3'-terminal phosphate cyclase [Infirmifilum lucidum]